MTLEGTTLGLIDRFRGALDAAGSEWAASQLRSQSVSGFNRSDWLGGGRPTVTGVSVTEDSAQRLVAVYAAINLISGSVATTPLHLYHRDGEDKGDRAIDHPLYQVLRGRPNPEMDALTFRELLTSHLCAWGNGYAEIVRDGQGRVVQLWPLRPDRMTVRDNTRSRVYDYVLPSGEVVGLLSKDVLHLRLRGDHLMGWSPIRMARESIGVAMAAEEFAGRFYGNGAHLGTILRHPARLSKDAHETLKNTWRDGEGLGNAHRTRILEEGMTVEKLGIPPDDAQFLETRQYQGGEIATLYAIPPHMLGMVDRSTSWGSGIEQQQIGFQTFTLLTYYSRWEYGIDTQCLTPAETGRYLAAHVIDNWMRAETTKRFAAYNVAVTTGWMSRAEVRRRENMPPGPPELDEFLTPVAVAQDQSQQDPAQPSPSA